MKTERKTLKFKNKRKINEKLYELYNLELNDKKTLLQNDTKNKKINFLNKNKNKLKKKTHYEKQN